LIRVSASKQQVISDTTVLWRLIMRIPCFKGRGF
jgi:hypothetical protein